MARFDSAVIRDPELLPLTSMVFLEDKKEMREESEGRITLDPLVCTKEGKARLGEVRLGKVLAVLIVFSWC